MSFEIMEGNASSYRLFWSGRSKKVKQAVEYYVNSNRKVSLVDAARKFDVSANSVGINVRLLRKQGFLRKVEKKLVWIGECHSRAHICE